MFVPGDTYRRREIHNTYGGQRQGGISTPSGRPLIFIFTGDSGEVYGYRDEFRPDGTFWYTGEGQVGDMEMVRGNRAIRDHVANGRNIHVFEYVKSGLVRYIGEANYLGHHMEERPDLKGTSRQAIIFEFEVGLPDQEPGQEKVMPKAVSPRTLRLWSRPLREVRRLATARPSKNAAPRERRAITYQRSQAVRVYVLRRANGVCEGCSRAAPFATKAHRPYLEPHHIRRLSDGGPDDPRWVAAVCPNCHREAHYGEKGDRLNESLSEYLGKVEGYNQ